MIASFFSDAPQFAGGIYVAAAAATAVDTTSPSVTVPGSITVDATSPTGAVVTFLATATDPDDVAGPVTCSPASGSLFAIGVTTVACQSTDSHQNTGTAGFTVTVLPPEQSLSNLIAAVGDDFEHSTNLLENALRSLNAGNTGAACNMIRAFMNRVKAQSGKSLFPGQANQLILSAMHIRAALGCQ